MFIENLKMSWHNIINNRMRSFLTALGIIIGVMSIISLITIVGAATGSITSQFSALGASKLVVSAPGTFLKQGLTSSDIAAIQQIPGVSGVSPTLNFNATVTNNAATNSIVEQNVEIDGKNQFYFNDNPNLVLRGRTINSLDQDNKNNVCLINTALQQIIFPSQDPLNKQITIMGRVFTVIGILDPNVTTDLVSTMQKARGAGTSTGKAIIPYSMATSMVGSNSITSLDVIVASTSQIPNVKTQLENALNTAFNYKDGAYSILDMDSLLTTMNTMMGIMTSMLAGIASIALLVGGIGIMNMMLVSVTERTTEIGLRKALGAQPSQIQMQFLLESVFLSLIGGIIGATIGVSVSYLVIKMLNVAFIFNMSALTVGVGFSAAVGIIFGWAPARRASRLNPIDALRSL